MRRLVGFCASLLLLPGLLSGCAGLSGGGQGDAKPEGGAGSPHDDPTLLLNEAPGVRLRSDLAPPDAEVVAERLAELETLLGNTFPLLVSLEGRPAPLTVLVQDQARLASKARRLGAKGADAFVTGDGTVFHRFRTADWSERWDQGPPYPLEPRVRPLANALLDRRLLLTFGPDLGETWIEEGLALEYLDAAARLMGDGDLVDRSLKDRLLDAYLPLYLGDRPALVDTISAKEQKLAKRATGGPALAWAVLGYVFQQGRGELVELALRRAAGEEVDEGAWETGLAWLGEREVEFERWLRNRVLSSALASFVVAPTPVDRWESAAALRLIANIDLYADDDDLRAKLEADRELRQKYADATVVMLEDDPGPRRFFAIDALALEIGKVREARSRIPAFRRLRALAKSELERRSAGYGHPAIEAAKRDLTKRLEAAVGDGI